MGENNSRKRRLGGRVCTIGLLLLLVTTVAVAPAAAQDAAEEDLRNQMDNVGSFLSIVISAVAIPVGAFGVFQYMTAGTDTEQTEKARKRIRNAFIGVAGAGAVQVAIELLNAMLPSAS